MSRVWVSLNLSCEEAAPQPRQTNRGGEVFLSFFRYLERLYLPRSQQGRGQGEGQESFILTQHIGDQPSTLLFTQAPSIGLGI